MNKERVGSSETPPLCCEFRCNCRCRETRQEIGRIATGGRIVAFFKRLRLTQKDPWEELEHIDWTDPEERRRMEEKLKNYTEDYKMTAPEVTTILARRPF